MWIKYNPNPKGKQVGDCTVRAITKATDEEWENAYSGIAVEGLLLADMPSANHVWGSYLKNKGFRRHIIPDDLPNDYSVKDFCKDNPKGKFVLALHGHVIAVQDGDYYDTWDSGDEVPIYYFKKDED